MAEIQTQRIPEVKAYTKGDLRLILSDPSVDIITGKNADGYIVTPIAPHTFTAWVKSFLNDLGLTMNDFKRIRTFTPKQVKIIFNELL